MKRDMEYFATPTTSVKDIQNDKFKQSKTVYK